jgi:hypothetical protein
VHARAGVMLSYHIILTGFLRTVKLTASAGYAVPQRQTTYKSFPFYTLDLYEMALRWSGTIIGVEMIVDTNYTGTIGPYGAVHHMTLFGVRSAWCTRTREQRFHLFFGLSDDLRQ